MIDINELRQSLGAIQPEEVAELLDRLEAAEKERDALRAKIKAREQQGPVAWLHETRRDSDVVTNAVKHAWGKAVVGALAAYSIPLYLAPGAQPALIEQDTSVRKAWARFSNELHRSPDAPYPGMADAFEQHFSQSFTDREWRSESATWAAAWKAAKRHEAQAQPAPSVPECPYPCGWRNLLALAIEDGAYLARSINEDEPVTENARAVTMRIVMQLRNVLMAINAAAPKPESKP